MRNIRVYAAAVSMTWVTAFAFTPEVDLKGAVAIAQGQCNYRDTYYVCFLLTKGDKKYMVPVDIKGPLAVYEIQEIKQDYKEGDYTLVWEREQDRRKSGLTT